MQIISALRRNIIFIYGLGLIVAIPFIAVIPYKNDSPDFIVNTTYPVHGVVAICIVTLVETLLLNLAIRPKSFDFQFSRPLWPIFLIPVWFMTIAMGGIGQPPYFFVHLIWLAVMWLLMVCLAFACVVVQLFRD